MRQWYEKLFENYAKQYDRESFTKGTMGECDFIEKELNFTKSLRIIDIGCGTGRHAVELTKRGYDVTGIDLSEAQLKRAREKAAKENLEVEFLRYDARDLPFEKRFDVAIMLCEGAFPLMESDEMNFQILKNVTQALRDPAKFIFTTLNGLYKLFRFHTDALASSMQEEGAAISNSRFDLLTMREHSLLKYTDDDGNRQEVEVCERYYLPSEITWLLHSLGYRKIEIFGATLGAFSREEPLTPNHFEMLVVAEK
jgi:2-polyprenyl-3-methyl-5-hydroxy-6-metoxy-1,4-benzoquinol methylase